MNSRLSIKVDDNLLCFSCTKNEYYRYIENNKRDCCKTAQVETLRRYVCYECNECPYQKQCNKYGKTAYPQSKSIVFNPRFQELREESYQNITSVQGINERINRSIQVEGMFSKLKEG